MSWQVRPANADDLPALPAVERAAATLFPPGRIADPDEVHDVTELQSYLAEGLLRVAADPDTPMGYVMACELDGALHVYELAVDPRFGRRGLGTALMQRVMVEADRRGLARVTLTTFEDLPWNAPFYRHPGFEALDDRALPEALRRLLDHERELGMTRRVAMCSPAGSMAS